MKKRRLYLLLTFLFCSFLIFAQNLVVDAGPYQKICPGTAQLGGNPTASGGNAPYTYAWAPTAVLNDSTAPNPKATLSATTTFTLTVTASSGDFKKDTVTVFVYSYSADAGKDTTIKSGQTITLQGTAPGAVSVYWQPANTHMYNYNTLTPDVFPGSTTTYTMVAGFNPGGCTLYDYVTVTVTPSEELFFYNTMTPNGDGANDYFLIGNIEKYPDNVLEIYNRYGQKVFNKMGYQNDWDGKYLNQELPAGTYFYILDTKSETGGKYHGQITILK